MQIRNILSRSGIEKLIKENREKLGEIVRFGIVGVLATIIQYAVYWLMLRWTGYNTAMTIGYLVSFTFNFVASTYFTFRVKANARRGVGFAFSHLVNWLLQMTTLNLFVWIGINEKWAPIPMFCICVPVNFLLVRFFLKNSKTP